jgi:hypothetical protein
VRPAAFAVTARWPAAVVRARNTTFIPRESPLPLSEMVPPGATVRTPAQTATHRTELSLGLGVALAVAAGAAAANAHAAITAARAQRDGLCVFGINCSSSLNARTPSRLCKQAGSTTF